MAWEDGVFGQVSAGGVGKGDLFGCEQVKWEWKGQIIWTNVHGGDMARCAFKRGMSGLVERTSGCAGDIPRLGRVRSREQHETRDSVEIYVFSIAWPGVLGAGGTSGLRRVILNIRGRFARAVLVQDMSYNNGSDIC